jgi:hypothetical protein
LIFCDLKKWLCLFSLWHLSEYWYREINLRIGFLQAVSFKP